MADAEQLRLLKQGVTVWNAWRHDHPSVAINLQRASLLEADLSGVNLAGANLPGARLQEANLTDANLDGATLTDAVLQSAILVDTSVEQAAFTGCSIYGISAWNIKGTPKEQTNLIISRSDEPTVTVDSLKIGQCIYVLRKNAEIREVIDTITSKDEADHNPYRDTGDVW